MRVFIGRRIAFVVAARLCGVFTWLTRVLVLLIASVAVSARAEQGILVLHVKDIQKKPVKGLQLAPEGTGSAAVTETMGVARIRLASQTKPESWVTLQILQNPVGKDFVMVSPWDYRTVIPSFENETENYVSVVVVERKDRAMLENSTVLIAIIARLNKVKSEAANGASGNDPTDNQQYRVAALTAVCRMYGLTPDEVDKAIRNWTAQTQGTFEKGMAALYAKNYPEATSKLRASLQSHESELRRQQSVIADDAFYLGRALYAQAHFKEAADSFAKAAKYRPGDTIILNNWALSLTLDGAYAAAEPLYREAISLDEKAHGSSDLGLARDLNNLGDLLNSKGDHAGAELAFRRALAIKDKTLANNDPSIATTLSNLAALLVAQGKDAAAEPLCRRALQIDEERFGSDRPPVAADLSILGEILRLQKDYSGAEASYRRVLKILETTLGGEHPAVAIALNDLGGVLEDEGNTPEAEALLTRALKIDKNKFTMNHPSVARDLNNLASVMRTKGDYAEAGRLYREALAIAERTLGPTHSNTEIIRKHLHEVENNSK